MKNIVYTVLFIWILLSLNACSQPSNNDPGSEYMPDMAHSVAYEANYYNYYYNNTWGSEDEYYELAQPRLPVPGTVPRTSAGTTANSIHFTPSGSTPYYYGDSDEERLRATSEIVTAPFPITDAGLARGKANYDIFCGVCHGAKGDGAGYLVRDPGPGDVGGMYPAAPANLLLDEFVADTHGRYYHAIMYGKNKMGGYADKLGHNERWEVIQYIRALQAKEKGLVYNQFENTFNGDAVAGEIAVVEEEMHHDDGHGHDADGHGHGHDGDGHGHDDDSSHDNDHDHEGDHSHDSQDHGH